MKFVTRTVHITSTAQTPPKVNSKNLSILIHPLYLRLNSELNPLILVEGFVLNCFREKIYAYEYTSIHIKTKYTWG